MSSLQAPGLGSGLDVNSLVTQLVAAERAPAQQRLTRNETEIDGKLSALGTLRGALSGFQSSVGALRTTAQVDARKAESGDVAVLRATAGASAAPGRYAVEVLSLASAHKLASRAFAGGSSSTVGTGTLSFAQGGRSFEITVAAGATLASLRDSINTASGNTGVRASLVQTDGGTRLVLNARESGSAQAIRVTVAGAAGGLDAFAYDPAVASPMTQVTAASDAQARVEGFAVTVAGNALSGAIEGVTLDLLAAKPGSSVMVTVAADTAAVRDRVSKMVSDFNSMAATLGRLRAWDPATRKGGPLIGDSTLLGVESRVRRDLASAVTASGDSPTTLAAVGVSMGADGRLTLNDARFTAALQKDPAGVARLFAGDDGIAKRLHATLEGAVGTGGQVPSRTDSLQSQKRDLQKAKEALDLRMQSVERRYRAQFTALDSLLSGLQSTGSYLARQLR